MARNLIVGVIGKSNSKDVDELESARLVGRSIARNRAILLTGGKPDENDRSIKSTAMLGAQEVENSRVVGVLPGEEAKTEIAYRRLLITTPYSSGGRNPINGMTPDIVLVFQGGAGTLSELAFALVNATKPIVLLGSYESMCKSLEKPNLKKLLEEGLNTYRDKISRDYRTYDDLLVKLHNWLKEKGRDEKRRPQTERAAEELLMSAIGRIGTTALEGPTGFPGAPGMEKAQFEEWLTRTPPVS